MKKLIGALVPMLCSLTAFAYEPKATLCYEEATQYASTIAADSKATVIKSELVLFDDVAGVQVEGWSFYTSTGKTLQIFSSADGVGTAACRLTLVSHR